ncbi:YaaW family protein [Leptolyngbya sp. AN03gr2]|uniref:YaaW family protein n=1 Tax=unclassified Leptolyngbya TaxID=2650499 RepID=UPI003D31C28E
MDEFRAALELATDDELRELTDILFRPKFNPLDYVNAPDPIDLQSQDREEWLDAIDDRFRFLAADGITVLRRKTGQVTYRQVLIQVCRYMKLPYSASLSTTDLEAEIFLSLLNRAWKQLPVSEQTALTQRVQTSLLETSFAEELPLSLQKNPMSLVVKGGSALAVNTVVQPLLLEHVARQFALHFARYQMAQQAIAQGGIAAATQIQTQVSMQLAKRGMTLATARYGATRAAFAFMGSALWAWFLADLGWRAIATNYGRVIPTIFALAQIRLTRSDYFEPA